MVNAIVSIPGYVHLYRSLLRFYDMPENEVREMLYLLNTANLDCYEYYHPERDVIQSGPVAFSGWLEHMDCRPYRTEVQLYKSLLFLKRSIDRDLIVTSQREALQTLRCIIGQRVCRRNTDETRIVLLKIWQELYTLSPALFASGLTGPFCQQDKCLEGKMTCGRKIDADMTPEDLLKADYPALFEGGGT